MIEKRFKKIIKLSILIAARQLWGLTGNVYQLWYQPYLTIRNLIKKRDKSQLFLLTSAALAPFGIYLGARVIWDHYHYGMILSSVGPIFTLTALVEIPILLFLGYWFFQVLRKK